MASAEEGSVKDLSRSRPKWRGGGLLPAVVAAVVLAGIVLAQRWTVGSPGSEAPVASESPGAVAGSPLPSADGLPSVGSTSSPAESPAIAPAPALRTELLDALAPTAVLTIPTPADLLSVSPDGAHALIWQAMEKEELAANTVQLFVVPLKGGDPIHIGTAGWKDQGIDNSFIRLADPAWSPDGGALAFENGDRGTIASLQGDPPVSFQTAGDVPISPLSGGRFAVADAQGPTVVGGRGGQGVPVIAAPVGLERPVWLGDGRSVVGLDAQGSVVWSDGGKPRPVAPPAWDESRPWYLAARTTDFALLAVFSTRFSPLLLVTADGEARTIQAPDLCTGLDVSSDGQYLAYEVCDEVGDRSIRLMRMSDGTLLDFDGSAGRPTFVPGTHRLVFLTTPSWGSPDLTLRVASKEILP